MNDNVITFVSNNVKRIETSQKKMKLFEYLMSYVVTNGLVFLQETHLTIRDEKKWEDEFNCKLFFLMEKQIHAVLIGYYGTKKIEVIYKKFDNSGRILLLEINIDDSLFVLINIYNANNELDQVKTLTDFGEILDKVGDIQNKNVSFSGDFNVIFYSFLEAQGGETKFEKIHFSKNNSNKEKAQPC